jgi:chloramphenicol-sensitive protein RarD
MNTAASNPSRTGVVCGLLSYGLWGLIPLYFKLVAQVSPLEVLAHRVLWSLVLLAIVITLLRRWGDLWPALQSRKVLLTLVASTLLLSLNWFTYIYAVSTNQVVEASLGYFLNPLVNVLIGVAILKERMRQWQSASVLLAGVGVVMLGVPLIALTLALSFAFYGLLRKTVAVEGLLGLFIETLLLLPVALAYIGYIEATHSAAFVLSDGATCAKLMASGVVTAVPLLLFTAAARRLRFSTLGFLQYLAPTIQFGLAVTRFGESMTAEGLAAFGCIWTAVAIYSFDSLRSYQQQRSESLRPVPME